MKSYLLCIILFCFVLNCGAQKDYQKIAERFQQFYNQEQSDSIFNLYAPVLKEQLSLEKNRAVITGLHVKFGDLRQLSLLKQDTGYAKYKASFKDQTLTLVLALNSADLIEGLRFIPFTPDPPAGENKKDSSNIFLKTPGGNIYGSLVLPPGSKKFPIVLIIAGSGPTDRNGNQGTVTQSNVYKMIADSLVKKGIATVRYDKRGVGESTAALRKESDLSFEDGINDAAGFVQMLKSDNRFSKVIVLGHSEGSLVGMVAALRAQADGYISVAGAGERIDLVIEKQIKAQSPALVAKTKILFDSLGNGYSVQPEADLLFLFRPSVQPYIKSWLKFDPQQDIKKLKMPVLIIQGTTDMQVSVENAKWLKAADPKAKLVLIEQMNHVLKQSGMDANENSATYNNPTLALKSELVMSIENFVFSVK
jgi:pimeloyl-ACP methyl ester carboxylesterase